MTTRKALTGDHNQCAACSAYFNSTVAFDKHRTGDHEGNQRRCLTGLEMLDKGMAVSNAGFWVTKLRTPGTF